MHRLAVRTQILFKNLGSLIAKTVRCQYHYNKPILTLEWHNIVSVHEREQLRSQSVLILAQKA